MTFYWWSHWFWITLLCNLFFPLVMVVHTYPSQESSQEYNQHHQNEQTKKLVTKLYQASTTLSWVTESSSSLARNTASAEKTLLQSVATSTTTEPKATITPITQANDPYERKTKKHQDGFEEYYYYYDDEEEHNKTEPIDLEEVEEEQENKDLQRQQRLPADEKMSDMKRSAENFSKSSGTFETVENPELSQMTTAATATTVTTTTATVRKNNFTNFTEQLSSSTNTSQNSANENSTHVSDSATIMASSEFASEAESESASASGSPSFASAVSAVSMSTLTTSNVTALPHAPPSTPKIVKSHNSPEWLNSMGEMVAAVSPPPLRVTTDVTDDKFPFTLENVHKSEDLRRDENEPRRRQSKGLSAEYKPGYINYSPESKNLLTRSASTTVNDYDGEENNISSEALSVQRAYFMDVGAISAICFTVFGIFCTVGTIGIVLYRRRFLNKPQALSEPDSSVYIDDSTMRVSDNSDEMYSLDNDSFLNSLEAMTIQNYWTDTVKHTKL